MEAITNRTIRKIEVEQLFGYYRYIVDHSTEASASNPLLIIYGDNGSGKTTILKMIFYLLSPVDKSGHKTKLSEIKFSKFAITLNDGTIISAERNNNHVSGSYTLNISYKDWKFSVFLEVNLEGSIKVNKNPFIEEQYHTFLNHIKNLNITINFLSDDRKTLSFSKKNSEIIKQRREVSRALLSNIEFNVNKIIDEEQEDSIDYSIRKLENWIRNNVLKGAKAGEENANTIYEALIKQISTPQINTVNNKQIKQLLEKIRNIKLESLKYNQSGLVSEFELDGFEIALASANESNNVLIYNILEPYIEGLQGRLKSLSNVQDILSKFLENINTYFSNKTISYDVESGFKLFHNYINEQIDFHSLSSGERQLLHLFSNVITSSEESTIFIIDEPEISLNIKWQRKLINTLLSFAANRNVQFIFASHSIELLGGHRNSVHKLVSI
ncbi:ATP-binding protein [Mucilaginibacter pallidiroseus]|nr:AAA family ATPase [Mucilaginibacter pallidiroseus]